MAEDGGRRRRWAPRRRACSPEGECAAVERLSDGAHGPTLSLTLASGGGPASARLTLSIHTARTKATPAVVMAAVSPR
jgi:hypothetical protein